MRLGEAGSGDVLRNTGNNSYYRFQKPEDKRVRIRPLELFPNGRLIEKPTDTIVEPTILVDRIGDWAEGMILSPPSAIGGKSRRTYEQERDKLEQKLADLQHETADVPTAMRGSHKNKIRAVEARLVVLNLGLTDHANNAHHDMLDADPGPDANLWELKDNVLLPSGRPGWVVGYLPLPNGEMPQASVLVRGDTGVDILTIDQSCLRPLANRHHATV